MDDTKSEKAVPGRNEVPEPAGTGFFPRVIPLRGIYNLRDMGGYAVPGGRSRRGLLYRSGELHPLVQESRAALEAMGIRTIVDFRDDEERARAPDGEIGTVRRTVLLPLRTGSLVDYDSARSAREADLLMLGMYRKFPGAARNLFREFFSLIQDPGNLPLLFHCAAGKDRTGAAAALFLAALGADRETICADYVFSAEALRGKYDDFLARRPEAEPFLTVRAGFILETLNTVDAMPGGMERYLAELGAEPETLRRLFVEDGG